MYAYKIMCTCITVRIAKDILILLSRSYLWLLLFTMCKSNPLFIACQLPFFCSYWHHSSIKKKPKIKETKTKDSKTLKKLISKLENIQRRLLYDFKNSMKIKIVHTLNCHALEWLWPPY